MNLKLTAKQSGCDPELPCPSLSRQTCLHAYVPALVWAFSHRHLHKRVHTRGTAVGAQSKKRKLWGKKEAAMLSPMREAVTAYRMARDIAKQKGYFKHSCTDTILDRDSEKVTSGFFRHF